MEIELIPSVKTSFDEKKENAVPSVVMPKELPQTIRLSRAITVGTTTYTEVVLKKYPKMKLVAHLPSDDTKQVLGHWLPMLAYMCELPMTVIEELSPKDYGNILEEAQSFL